MDRGRQTRNKTRTFFQEGWRWSEALLHVANKGLSIQWHVAGVGISAQVPVLVEPQNDRGDEADSDEFYSVPDEWRSQPSKPKDKTKG